MWDQDVNEGNGRSSKEFGMGHDVTLLEPRFLVFTQLVIDVCMGAVSVTIVG